MPSECHDHIESAEAAEGSVRWDRYYGTRKVRCTVTRAAIDNLRVVRAIHAEASPVAIFKLHLDKIAAAVSRKYAAQDFNHHGEIVVGVGDL